MEDTSGEDKRPTVLSRRQALRRIGGRAAAVGVGMWIAPEIIIGTATEAGALSAPPTRNSGGTGGGSGGSGGSGGDAAFTGASTSPQSQVPSPSDVQTFGSGGSEAGASGQPAGSDMPGSFGVNEPVFPFVPSSPSHKDDFLSAANIERDLGIAGGLVAGGWLIQRWVKERGGDSQPESP